MCYLYTISLYIKDAIKFYDRVFVLLLTLLLFLATTCVVELYADGQGCVTLYAKVTEGLIHLFRGHGAAVKNYGCAGVVDVCVFEGLLGREGLINDVGVTVVG